MSGIGDPLAGLLLGDRVIKPGLQVISYRRVLRLVYLRRWAWGYGG